MAARDRAVTRGNSRLLSGDPALEAVAPGYLSPDAIRTRYDAYRAQSGR